MVTRRAAPPVYRPQPAVVSRMTAPPVYRPNAPATQKKPAVNTAALGRSAAPPVYRPVQSIMPAPPVYRGNSVAPNRIQSRTVLPKMAPPPPKLIAPVVQPKYRAKGRLVTVGIMHRGWYTAGGKYFVSDSNPYKLFSSWGADPPRPTALYTKSWEWFSGLLWSTWTPKVKFLRKRDYWDLGVPYNEYQAAIRNEDPMIIGKNDCSIFAGIVASQISEELALNESSHKLEGQSSLAKFKNVGVGTYMRHTLPNREDCEYHAATVVAVDGGDLVTLEADVSDQRTRPKFEIRTGLLGFVRDNDPNMTSGDELVIDVKNSDRVNLARNTARGLEANDARSDYTLMGDLVVR
jgi:hypothetical protein